MGAKNTTVNSGRRNYYGVAYGALSTRVKEVPADYEEITADELKSLNSKKKEIDLRNKYVVKSGDYPYAVFYQTIEGEIVNIVTKQPQNMSKMLELEILDSDGDVSFVSMNLYSRYTENLLNRLNKLSKINNTVLSISPYSIPQTFKGKEGNDISIYNQGFSIKVNGNKLEVAYTNDDKDLPPTERVQDTQGNDTTSRVKRINFLLDKALGKFNPNETPSTTPPVDVDENEDDGLPF